MAAGAIFAELPIVYVVGAMTASAGLRAAFHRGERLAVTTVAAHLGVRAGKCEIALTVMIKAPIFPVDRRVAGRAVRRKAIVVRIFVGMTIDAGAWCIKKSLSFVTGLAFNFGMVAQ